MLKCDMFYSLERHLNVEDDGVLFLLTCKRPCGSDPSPLRLWHKRINRRTLRLQSQSDADYCGVSNEQKGTRTVRGDDTRVH